MRDKRLVERPLCKKPQGELTRATQNPIQSSERMGEAELKEADLRKSGSWESQRSKRLAAETEGKVRITTAWR